MTGWDDASAADLEDECKRLVYNLRASLPKQPAVRKKPVAHKGPKHPVDEAEAPAATPLKRAGGSAPSGVSDKRARLTSNVAPNLDKHLPLQKWPCSSTGGPITVGSDCSGLESVTEALIQMGLGKRVQLKFCSDIDPTCRTFLNAMHKPSLIYHNVANRNHADAPHVDLYTAGFPCQPWSVAGKGQGRKDKKGRGKIFDNVCDYISVKSPAAFLLENVQSLTFAKHKQAFDAMIMKLRASGKYFVSWRVLNTRDFGIPQNRPRVFIAGLLRSRIDSPSFSWPKPTGLPPLDLEQFLIGGDGMPQPLRSTSAPFKVLQHNLKHIKDNHMHPLSEPFAVDVHEGRADHHYMHNCVPCITRSRGGQHGFYITTKGRLLTTEEMLMLQGLPTSYRDVAQAVGITDTQLGQMVGNAISTNVLKVLLCRILTKIGLHQGYYHT